MRYALDSTIETYICGIPCRVVVDSFTPGYPPKINADPAACYEGADPEIEFTVLDRRGRPAPWLERKMTDHDLARIERQIIEENE